MFNKKGVEPYLFDMLKLCVENNDYGLFIDIETSIMERGNKALYLKYQELLDAEYGNKEMAKFMLGATKYAVTKIMKRHLGLDKILGS